MYTSRNYLSYKRYDHTLHKYDNPTLETLKSRRAKQIKQWRENFYVIRILIKAHSKLIRNSLFESNIILDNGSIII